jgi:hypothetical protein
LIRFNLPAPASHGAGAADMPCARIIIFAAHLVVIISSNLNAALIFEY